MWWWMYARASGVENSTRWRAPPQPRHITRTKLVLYVRYEQSSRLLLLLLLLLCISSKTHLFPIAKIPQNHEILGGEGLQSFLFLMLLLLIMLAPLLFFSSLNLYVLERGRIQPIVGDATGQAAVARETNALSRVRSFAEVEGGPDTLAAVQPKDGNALRELASGCIRRRRQC